MNFHLETNFNTKNIYNLSTIPLKELVDVSSFFHADDFLLYSFQNHTIISGDFQKEELFQHYGIESSSFILEIQKNPHLFPFLLKSNKNSNPIFLLHKDFKHHYQKYGLSQYLNNFFKKPHSSISDFISKNPFKDYSNSNYEFMQLIHNTNNLQLFKDSNNQLYLQPFILTYISANLDNGHYHLEPLIQHLMLRDDVAFITHSPLSNSENILPCPLNGNEVGISHIISDIPYYNSQPDSNQSISLVFYPSPSSISNIINWHFDDNYPHIWNIDNYIVRVLLQCEQFSKKNSSTSHNTI